MVSDTARSSIETSVAGYYGRAFDEHGPGHAGVDWSSADSQELRFRTLVDGINWTGTPSLLDYGCGYGALAGHLDRIGATCRYVGHDVVATMIESARSANRGRRDRHFTTDESRLEPTDHVIASGIFNVKLDVPAALWDEYVWETIGRLGSLAKHRLAFNMLPPASAPELARSDLHYADPREVVERCEAALGGRVVLVRGYGLWEFTVIVDFDDGPSS